MREREPRLDSAGEMLRLDLLIERQFKLILISSAKSGIRSQREEGGQGAWARKSSLVHKGSDDEIFYGGKGGRRGGRGRARRGDRGMKHMTSKHCRKSVLRRGRERRRDDGLRDDSTGQGSTQT